MPSQADLQQAREHLILALDFPSASDTFALLARLDGLGTALKPTWVKVGLELFLAEGRSLVSDLRSRGFEVFLDLKLYDIPNTVASAIRSLLPLGPSLLTVHAAGGAAMLEAAAEAAGGKTRLLAVTVLTSMDAGQLTQTGVSDAPDLQVARLARLAAQSGIDGLVCSPHEAAALRALLPEAHLVTPGIRPAGAAPGDQQRHSTPAAALRAGANQLVVGRPITADPDPAAAYLRILREIAGELGPLPPR